MGDKTMNVTIFLAFASGWCAAFGFDHLFRGNRIGASLMFLAAIIDAFGVAILLGVFK